MRRIAFVLTLLIVQSIIESAYADASPVSQSLFFSSREYAVRQTAAQKNADADKNDESILRFETLIYSGPEDWSFWMNGKRYDLTSLPSGMTMVEVNEGTITFDWHDEDEAAPIRVTLSPSQSFDTIQRRILAQ